MANVALQLEAQTIGAEIQPNDNVIFDSMLYKDGDVSYNSNTGEITITKPGRFLVHWWLAIQSSASQTGVCFGLAANAGPNQMGNSPMKTGEISGFGMFNVTESNPVVFSLRNLSQQTFYFSQQTLIKGSIIVVETIEEITPAYGFVYNGYEPLNQMGLAIDTDMVFFSNGPLVNINHTPPSSDIYITEPGDYEIRYNINLTSPIDAVFVITVNDTPVYSTATNSNLQTGVLTNSAILTLSAGDVVKLRIESVQ